MVEELIDGLWSMDQEYFENKYESLSINDKFKLVMLSIDLRKPSLMVI